MSAIVKRTFKAASDIVAGAVPDRRHRLGRSQAPASRTTNEKQIVTQFHTKRLQFASQAFREARIHRLVGKGLPLYEHSPFADRP